MMLDEDDEAAVRQMIMQQRKQSIRRLVPPLPDLEHVRRSGDELKTVHAFRAMRWDVPSWVEGGGVLAKLHD